MSTIFERMGPAWPPPEVMWPIVLEQMRAMTAEERVESLKSAGILTETGEVAEPYRDVIVPKRELAGK